MKISKALEKYKESKDKNDFRLKSTIKKLNGFFGNKSVYSVSRKVSEEYLRSRKVSPQTVERELNVLAATLNYCFKNKLIKEKPEVINIKAQENVRSRWLTKIEIKRLLNTNVLKSYKHIDLACKIALTCAARKEAILGLLTSQIYWDSGKRGLIDFRISDANKKPRSIVPVPQTMVDELKLACQESKLGFVIQANRGRPVKEVHYLYKKAVKEAELGDDVCFHTLRHTCAVHMAQSGNVSMNELSSYLGHTSTKITEKHYAKFFPEYMVNSSDVASDLIN